MLSRRSSKQPYSMTHCSFCLAAEGLTPDELSARMGMACDAGEVLQKAVADMSFASQLHVSTWVLRSRVPPNAPPEEHVYEMIRVLEQRAAGLQGLLDVGALAEIRLAVLAFEMFPRVELDPSIAGRLSALNVPLLIYVTREEEWSHAIDHIDFGEHERAATD